MIASGNDILLSALGQSDRRFRACFELAPTPMMLVGTDGRWRQLNWAMYSLLGLSPDELVSLTIHELVHPADIARDASDAAAVLAGAIDRYEVERRFLRADGEEVPTLVTVAAIRGDDGDVDLFVHHVQDLTERRSFERQLQDLANRDPLTGLISRARFAEVLESRLRITKGFDGHGAVVLVDVDGLELVNERHGHDAGDATLVAVARALGGCLRSDDVLARFDGDKFALLLQNLDEPGVGWVARRLLAAVRVVRGPGASASIGIAPFAGPADASGLVCAAAAALRAAKSAGGDRFELAGREMSEVAGG